MFGRRARIKCFNATYSAGSYAGRADLGYGLVPVAQIVGSVGRCQELDERFQPLKLTRLRLQRLEKIRRLAAEGAILPPVELYKLKDEYFVVDGHHRVAVARENRQGEIDAHVIEFLPNGERIEDRLYLEQRAFAYDTGLDKIRLSQLGYGRLREEIKRQQVMLSVQAGKAVSLPEAAAAWYRQEYQPVAQAIIARRLPLRLPGCTVGDIYLELDGLRTFAHQEGQGGLSLEQAIARLEALYPLPTRRQRLAQAWHSLLGRLEAWWRGLRAEPLPCAYAQQAPDGTVYCRREGSARRGVFER